MAIKRLSKRDVKELGKLLNISLSKKDIVEIIESNNQKLVRINGDINFFYLGERIIPTLHYLENTETDLKSITVDKGAVRFVVSGADIMRPGIVHIDEGFSEGDIILIREETYNKPIAIGIALLDSDSMKSSEKGKVVKNLHYVGDKIWVYGKK